MADTAEEVAAKAAAVAAKLMEQHGDAAAGSYEYPEGYGQPEEGVPGAEEAAGNNKRKHDDDDDGGEEARDAKRTNVDLEDAKNMAAYPDPPPGDQGEAPPGQEEAYAAPHQPPPTSAPSYPGAPPAMAAPLGHFDCPADKVGKIIGKSGSTVEELQNRYGVRIQIDQSVQGATRPVTITGPPEAVAAAMTAVKELASREAGHGPLPGDSSHEMDCPPTVVGRIIGRGGETIRSMQTATGAHINVDQNVPSGAPRKITITGKPDQVSRAASMINELITGEPSSAQAVIAKYGIGQSRVTEVPKNVVGKVIGKGGETIKNLQRMFACGIQVDQSTNPCRITVTGPPGAVDNCLRAVIDAANEGQMGGGYPGAPRMGGPMGAPYGGMPAPYGAPSPYGAPPAGYGGYAPPAYPAAGGYGGYPGAAAPAPGGYGGGYAPQPAYGAPGGAAAGGGYPGAAAPAAGGYPGAAPQAYGAPQAQPYGAPMAAPQAPAGGSGRWQQVLDESSGHPYYYNASTGQSVWEKPADF